ncbi:hypothetical protein J4475_02580 [Candidatus Woesearchaeota archaeon]|nr:hypothetical protein [Candidatus Woesearchaeota archaeon]
MTAFIQFFISTVIAAFGFAAGAIIGRFARPELNTGKKYFPYLKKAILAALLLVAAYSFQKDMLIMLVLSLGIIAVFAIDFRDRSAYLVCSVALLLLDMLPEKLYLGAGLVFLYGLPAGSQALHEKRLPKSFLWPMMFAVLSIALHATLPI